MNSIAAAADVPVQELRDENNQNVRWKLVHPTHSTRDLEKRARLAAGAQDSDWMSDSYFACYAGNLAIARIQTCGSAHCRDAADSGPRHHYDAGSPGQHCRRLLPSYLNGVSRPSPRQRQIQ